ncbi:hypothetical protein ACFVJ5_27340 [Nocardia sp. NPDC127606]|uniref:hypothetical protein n=1 Tax=Nocardia sp. NPDC127606 TaxID=3345406 RepID=UPI00362AA074
MAAPAGWTAQLEIHKFASGSLEGFVVHGTAPTDTIGQTYSISVVKDVPEADSAYTELLDGDVTIEEPGRFELSRNVGCEVGRNATYGPDYSYEISASQPDPDHWGMCVEVGVIGRGKTNVNL